MCLSRGTPTSFVACGSFWSCLDGTTIIREWADL